MEKKENKARNQGLAKAAMAKNDEFYTLLTDIEKELRHYREHFKDKVILCNCDDPFESNFFKYFVLNFNRLGLKKLIATCYATSPIANEQISLLDVGYDEASKGRPYKAVVTKVYDTTGDGSIDMIDVAELFKSKENELVELEGDGDFRSKECLELLKEADIVVSNPPFSLFREYVDALIKYDKKFIIWGNTNAVTYKDIFRLIVDSKIWGGFLFNKTCIFQIPDKYEKHDEKITAEINDGNKYCKVPSIATYTNLDIRKRHEDLILIKRYNSEDYPKYDNYDAINIDKVADIPYDYEGVMGVPITFLDKFNPEQFEILGYTAKDMGYECHKFYEDLEQSLNGKPFVRNMKSARFSPMIRLDKRPQKTHYRASNVNGYLIKTYGRILIRNKRPEIKEGK